MNIFEFPDKRPKSGLKRVSRKSCKDDKQLDLFSKKRERSNILEMSPELPPFEEALFLDESGNYSAAKAAYQNAIEADDCTADAYCNLGILEYESGNTVKALDLLTRALSIEPRHFEAHYNMANLYAEIGNLPLAKTHYEFSRELSPEYPDIYFNLGIIYAMTKDFTSALNTLEEYKNMVTSEEGENAEKLMESIRKLIG